MTTAVTTARTYDIDKAHSEAGFEVRHLLTRVRGRFAAFGGTITVNEETPSLSSVSVTIQAGSIDTNEPNRDTHLRSADFFSVEEFPTLHFSSTAVAPGKGDDYIVTGDLTIRGVTKRIEVPVSFLGRAKDPWGVDKVGFEAQFTINRKDFGLSWNAALETGGFLVGDDVKVTLSVQAAEPK